MFEEIFLKSMVKGIGKATGTMLVLGVVGGGIWYASQPKKVKKMKKQVTETKETQTVQMESVDNDITDEETQNIDDENTKEISSSRRFLVTENKYKEIFDKLRS